MSGGLIVLKNCLIWLILLVFLTIPLLLLKVWKSLVVLSARVLRPSLRPFEARDTMTIETTIYTKPLINIGFILKVQGKICGEEFRLHFYNTLLEPLDPRTGERVNKNLLRFYKRFWGYAFKQGIKLRDLDLDDMIYESSLRKGEKFSDFVKRFFYSPYEEGKPLWSVALLHSVDPSELNESFDGTTLLFRLHHSLGDGYSLMYLFEQLAGVTSRKKLTPIFRERVWDKARLLFGAPSIMMDFGKKISSIPNPFRMPCSNIRSVNYAFLTLDLELIKTFRSKAGVHMTSILLTLLGSVLRAVLLEENAYDSTKLPEYICTASSLPWPDHPKDKMCNEWTVGLFKIPIKNPNMLERLREMEKDYIDFHETGVHKIIKRVMLPVMSLLPVAILQKSTQVETSVAASWSPMVAGDNYNLLGNEVANIWPFVGNTIEGMAVVTVSLSHSQKIDIALAVNEEFVSDWHTFNRITSEFFPKELQALTNLLEL